MAVRDKSLSHVAFESSTGSFKVSSTPTFSRRRRRTGCGRSQANTMHPDFVQAARSSESRLVYAALLIGKESIAFNDRTGMAGDFLEKLLDFFFKLQGRSRKRGGRHGMAAGRRRAAGRPP